MSRLFSRKLESDHMVKRIVARLLWHSRTCLVLTYSIGGIRLRFWPTALSARLWYDPGFIDEELRVLGLLREGDTFVDVGANVGVLTCIAARRVGPQGKVFAIEPHPQVFEYLRRNVAINGFLNVKLIQAAVGDQSGTLHVSDLLQDDMNRIQEKGTAVPVITLDSLGVDGSIALLKMDTEGYEPFVMAGARKLLQKTRAIYFECSQWNLERYGRSSHELISGVQDAGFVVYRGNERVNSSWDASVGGNLFAVRENDAP